jgi:hypothetical protein
MFRLDIDIVHGHELLDSQPRPLYRLADGALGALYQGAVYRLSGNSIDLAGPWTYVAECNPLLSRPPDLPSDEGASAAAIPGVAVDDRGRLSWLFVEGSDVRLARLLEAATRCGLPPRGYGHWNGALAENVHVDAQWAVELDGWQPADDLIRRVAQAFSQTADDQQPTTATRFASPAIAGEMATLWLSRELHILREVALDASNRQAREAADLIARTGLLQAAAQAAKEALHGAIERQIESDERARRLSAELTRLAEVRTDELRQVEAGAQELIDEALAEVQRSDQRRIDAEEVAAALQAQITELQAAATAAARQSPEETRSRSRSSAREQWIATSLSVLAPRIDFLRDSISALAEEIDDPRAALSIVAGLDRRPETVRGKKLQAAGGWWELHFSTGQSDDGRIYWRRRKPPDDGFEVLISRKRRQERDLVRLARM